MKKLQLPSSYAALSPEEQCAAFGGSEFGDAVGSFFDNLHLNDFFWNGGLISFSFTFVPMLLFNVIRTGYRAAETIYNKLSARYGYQDETLTAFQQYTDEMRNKHQKNNA